MLTGRIELRAVRFKYGEGEPDVLDGVNLVVEPGDHVAITGPSGEGKSTLVKVMLGLLEPDSGQLLVDGIPLGQFGYANYHNQVAAVLQDDNLFAGNIRDNIALFEDGVNTDRVIEAANGRGDS